MNSKKIRIVATILYTLTLLGVLIKFNINIFTESIAYLLVGLGGLFFTYTEKENKLIWGGGIIILAGSIIILLSILF